MASTQAQSERKRRSGSTRRTSRPLIGITTSDHKSFLAWWCDWISVWRAGGRPLRISPARPLRRPVDGLIIGGGDDIGAQRYGGEMQLDVRIDPARDELELELLARYLPERIPILGICRGAQIINIHCGGSLIEDIQTTYRHIRNRRMVLPRKRIEIEPFSQLADILNRRYCHVNSLHHQAVDRPGDGLKVVAHDRDDLVQAIESDRHPFLIGVQWHPEFLLFSRSQQRLIRALVDAARLGAATPRQSPGDDGRSLDRSDDHLQ
ncbi:type 1 glutamine amidotransferase [Salinicola corii]|uniref:Type 1 glutamine amidotransferase n=1 Tax=Salinicola corii TaxID=2606937 RepID=A0A640WJB4_9GAMM|nr:type 1 glutamine amidotransferase [Salinicola corii]KAA0020694.1 type 1 glutamine amidotransferase [Salinicola corii]